MHENIPVDDLIFQGINNENERPTPLLEVRDLSYTIQNQTLLKDINLALSAGSRTIIMGPNGAGKSLLLRLMHGLLSPSSGNIFWQDRPIDKAAIQCQAMVFQKPVLLRRSVLANLNFALSVKGLNRSKKKAAVQKALDAASLSHLAKRPARVLSAGEQQRLSLARALACEPELLFLDEPTANLDQASTAAIEALIMDANERGITIVMITHDMGQARRVGEDLIFLQDGEIAETGNAKQVLKAPKSEPLRALCEGRIYLSEKARSARIAKGDSA